MPELKSDDPRKAARLEAIRARRGTPQRAALLEQIAKDKQAARLKRAPADARKTPQNSSQFFGHAWSDWFRMRDLGIAHLRSCATKRRMTTYKELWQAIGDGMECSLGSSYFQLPHLLGHIADAAFAESNLIPTALVVYDGTAEGPGPGFFRLAESYGLVGMEDSPPQGEPFRMTANQERFWKQQVDAMFARYVDA